MSKEITLEDIKRFNPALYEECLAMGVQEERARILTLLPKKPQNERERYAVKCVQEGTPFNNMSIANYLAMSMTEARITSASEQVVAAIEKRFGIVNHDS